MTNHATTLAFVGIMAAGLGCSAPEPSGLAPQTAAALAGSAAIQTGSSVISGYRHMLAASKFYIGSTLASSQAGPYLRTIGSDGVFSVHNTTGFAMATPNAKSAAAAKPAYSSNGDVHNAAVKDYFVSCGLPADQILFVSAHATVHTLVKEGDSAVGQPMTFDWYSSVISRQVNGIPVPDSFAWARMNASGEVVAEAVFWPDLPVDAVNTAEGLAAASPAVSGADRTGQGRAVIRHTGPTFAGAFAADATFDVPPEGEMGHVRHFNANGAEVFLAYEKPTPAPATHRPSRVRSAP